MSVQVVEDEVDDLALGDACVEQIEEVEEDLLGPVRSDHPDDPAGVDEEPCGEAAIAAWSCDPRLGPL